METITEAVGVVEYVIDRFGLPLVLLAYFAKIHKDELKVLTEVLAKNTNILERLTVVLGKMGIEIPQEEDNKSE